MPWSRGDNVKWDSIDADSNRSFLFELPKL